LISIQIHRNKGVTRSYSHPLIHEITFTHTRLKEQHIPDFYAVINSDPRFFQSHIT
jgi:hypothetical protein